MAKKMICSCGTKLNARNEKLHRSGVWHRVAREARKLRNLGCSYSEVARQVGAKKAIIYLRLKGEGL